MRQTETNLTTARILDIFKRRKEIKEGKGRDRKRVNTREAKKR